ncbi:septum formation family protein [Actinomyces wuliandei]|uniref:septum formation family protein n=1 Tax=Actinomyces wuliandei TaxID=2057743 RepID=UPI000FD7A0C3|nr:septum formation family protein [Actinomyces wuliandei]
MRSPTLSALPVAAALLLAVSACLGSQAEPVALTTLGPADESTQSATSNSGPTSAPSNEASPSQTPSQSASPDSSLASVDDLEVGDCLTDTIDDVMASNNPLLHVTDCDDSHYLELYHTGEAADDAYETYDEEALTADVETTCTAQFPEYASADVNGSDFQMLYLYPKEMAWHTGDREFLCFALRIDKSPMTGSIAEGGGVPAEAPEDTQDSEETT